MSTGIRFSALPKLQEVPANDSSSDSTSNEKFVATATYQDLISDPHLFEERLREFLRNSEKTLKILVVGGISLDLHQLSIEVTSRGGIEKVIKDRKCKEVIEAFNLKIRITNEAHVLRKNYLKLLFGFEHVYFFQESISSFGVREEALMRFIEKSTHHDNDFQGLPVKGVISGKFDGGYFVTMKVGSQELNGVLYPITPSSAETRRRKKKPKVDANKPKLYRSGYNFFLYEHYSKLKTEYVGQERALIKKIGNMWSNLSESERQVYREKGFLDHERYKAEMLEYRSSLHSRATETASMSAVMPDAAVTADEVDH